MNNHVDLPAQIRDQSNLEYGPEVTLPEMPIYIRVDPFDLLKKTKSENCLDEHNFQINPTVLITRNRI